MKVEDFDAVLVVQQDNVNNINENSRMLGTRSVSGVDIGPRGTVDLDDPGMYGMFNFGAMVRDGLRSMADGFWSEVTDFKKWVVITVGYHHYITGRSANKTFLVVFENSKGDGTLLSSNSKWRSVSGAQQVISYVKSACQTLKSDCERKI